MSNVLQHPETDLTAACAPAIQFRIQYQPSASVVSADEIDLLASILPDIIQAMIAEEAAETERHPERSTELCM